MKTEKELQELQQQCRDFQKVTGGFLPVFIGFP